MRENRLVTAEPPAPLVGRRAERAALAAALRTTPGADAPVVVTGEPGIGKTRLLTELAAQATAAGYAVRGARASEHEADLPYSLLGAALGAELPGFTGADGALVVGRTRELAELGTALDAARAGTRQVALVAGEPGIGKTTLVRAFLSHAAAQVGAPELLAA